MTAALKTMRARLTKEIENAEEMIAFIDEYKMVFIEAGDTRTEDERIEGSKATYQRLIDNYTRYIAVIDKKLAEGEPGG